MGDGQALGNKADMARLRRVALASQGLSQAAPFGRGPQGVTRAISHIGYVQIDTISVVERAHHHVLASRVPNYAPKTLNRLLKKGEIFEYWSHAAAFMPMADYRFSLPYKLAIRAGKRHWQVNPDRKLMAELLARIRSEGALRSRDTEDGRETREGWWDWKPAKKALEQLFMEGELMVAERDGFQKSYDLPERVIPAGTDTTAPTTAEYAAHLLDQQIACHGFVTQKGATYSRRDAELRAEMKRLLDERVAQGTLNLWRLRSGERLYGPPDLFDRKAPRVPSAVKILSPFDNAVIQRDRLRTLFDYDYQIECYVTEKKRQFGYFCLPLLYRDAFVGRLDAKAHRKEGRLEIKALHIEDSGVPAGELLEALAQALPDFMRFQACDTLHTPHIEPRALRDEWRAAIAKAELN